MPLPDLILNKNLLYTIIMISVTMTLLFLSVFTINTPAQVYNLKPFELNDPAIFNSKDISLIEETAIPQPVPESPVQETTAVYVPFVHTRDKVDAVMFGISDPYRDGKAWMTTDDVMETILKTAYHLTQIKVKVILPAGMGQSLNKALDDLKKMGADMNYVQNIPKSANFTNHLWMRDYGPLPIRNSETGEWATINMNAGNLFSYYNFLDTSFLTKYLEENYGMKNIGSYDVTRNEFMGGNIMVDEQGRCFSAGLVHPLYNTSIKCSKVITFPCKTPVCHADEYITFLKNNTIVTNKPEFIPQIREAGYERILTIPDEKEISFTNVLIVNNHIFLMYTEQYKPQMEQARAVYEGEGYTVLPVLTHGTGAMSGAIHCLTKEIPVTK